MVKQPLQLPEVMTTDSGFRVAGGAHPPADVAWCDIVEIVAFKLDAFACDIVCLGFRLRGASEFIEVAEDCPGYEEFIKCVAARFTLAENWWSHVAFPAFETNWSTIWESEIQS